jgi:hypothetical protein
MDEWKHWMGYNGINEVTGPYGVDKIRNTKTVMPSR